MRKACLRGAGGAVDRRADVAGDVDRGEPDPAAGVVDQHGLAGLQRTHDHEQLPRGEIAHRNRRGLLVRERGGLLEDLRRRHRDDVRVAAEAGQSDDLRADQGLVDPAAHRVHHARHFIADDGRKLGGVGIETLARQDVGEVDAARLDANPHLPRLRRGVGCFAHLQLLRAPMTDDDDLLHGILPTVRASSERGALRVRQLRAVVLPSPRLPLQILDDGGREVHVVERLARPEAAG